MENKDSALLLGMVVLWGVLMSGCSLGSAALGPGDCGSWDHTMTCCIRKHPYDPVGACGATASDIEEALKTGAAIENALQRRTDEGEEEDEDEEGDPDEGWKQHCIDTFVQCRGQMNLRWVGDCYACFRLCEGQRQWPFHLCKPRM